MQTKPYGSWQSPITTEMLTRGAVGLGQVQLDGEDVYWLEARPEEKGRYVVVRWRDGATMDLVLPDANVRTRVHEYGGGAYCAHNGTLAYVNFKDQQLYRVDDGQTRQLTHAEGLRFADFVWDVQRNRLIGVIEDHNVAPGAQPINCIGAIDLQTGDVTRLAEGNDFYASPRLSPNGRQLCWQTWNHPNMPWDGNELWLADVSEDGKLINHRLVAGGPNESIFQPEWLPNGELYFVSDSSNWWNVYGLRNDAIEPMCVMDAEFGGPQWAFGYRKYGFISPSQIFCTYLQHGSEHFALLDAETKTLTDLNFPYTVLGRGGVFAANGKAVFTAASATQGSALVLFDLASRRCDVLRKSSQTEVDPGYISVPQAIEFPTESGKTAHAFFYPPRNKDYEMQTSPLSPRSLPADWRWEKGRELPPLLVMSHGGPTGATDPALSLRIQYWTSRGIAVLDVNYGGSTGYGREYRQRLNGTWGITDVDDCVNGAKYLAAQGLVDGERLMITGGSAGGYTTLCALAFRNTFKAGASYYGVSDAEALATDTHKFESRYLDNLIGPYPERKDIYIARSPIHFAHQISAPAIFLQGLDDPVVPPSQSEKMFEAIRNREIPTAYIAFEGESHGFRQAKNIQRSIEAELYFYSRVFGFHLADAIVPVDIENLDV
jgi:dipeptidyl aminopeptidase/acylaminoacyl peptidase